MKMRVVQVRASFKDYVDIVRILEEGIGLSTGLAAAIAVYGPAAG
jgi:hypothetical protein